MTKENHTSLLKMIHFSSRIEEASVKGFFYGYSGKRFQKHSFQCWNYGCFGHSDYYIFSIQIIKLFIQRKKSIIRLLLLKLLYLLD